MFTNYYCVKQFSIDILLYVEKFNLEFYHYIMSTHYTFSRTLNWPTFSKCTLTVT